ncbi:phospholipase D family protein [Streptomyces acidiscabies]|uniref:Phospholipase D family protein n=1 Tax=Streptomyces acidiscabies TaxID=42234 RepID=A0AAP6BL42_9ACTN|nr:phospholipase D family protein [Streptomyces acidiscabies]MDX2966563.1 phospholipase D family protein [Streptomyces acidiscabies]MDX3016662.1 phospholipase D family protein [Streptomyces acidiscabies]MDX3788430.1 phospholipase D family protein [Streptomyces acidiscabies]
MTQPDHVWQQIADLMKRATTRVILVAPFVKKAVFEETLASVPTSVEKIECVTRWTPAEVAAGVSDPEIIEAAERDERVQISLCPPLHAKIYVADDRCLVGSANLTGKATGRVPNANVELLLDAPVTHPEVQRVLSQINARSTAATPLVAALVRQQAELLKEERITPPAEGEPASLWYPETRRPENVFALYSGRTRFTSPVEAGIIQDLAMLDVPAGLAEHDFNSAVEVRLHAIPELHKLLVGERLGNIELQKAIVDRTGEPEDQARRTTETLAAWLQHFGRYYTEVGSWELRPGREHT